MSWTNRAFAAIFPPDDDTRQPFEAPHGPLDAAPDAWREPRAPGDKPGVYVLRPPAWRDASHQEPAKSSVESLRQEAAHALATWLLELFADAGALSAENTEGTPLRQPHFSSIATHIARSEPAVAILFSDNVVKSLYEEVLRARGVSFVSLRGRGFFSCDAVRWSLLLWRALLDSDDEAAWVGLLRSPLGGQSDLALLERHLSRRAETSPETPETEADFTPTDPHDAAMWGATHERLERWRALASVAPVSLVMERVLEESEVAFFESAQYDAPVRRENWRKLLDLVRDREGEGEGGLRPLVDYFEAHQSDDREPVAPLPSGASIQLMTVHASKGLGFPACVLAQLESAKRTTNDSSLLWGELNGEPLAAFSFGRERDEDNISNKVAYSPLAYELLRHAASQRALSEWKRLFYVACTRAQSHLVLLETDANPPVNSWGDLVRPAMGGVEELSPSARPATSHQHSNPSLHTIIEPQKDTAQAPTPFPATAARELRFDALFGPPSASLKDAQKRAWLESHLRSHNQNTDSIRQNIPFGARGALFAHPETWIVGAWEWIASLETNRFLLLATGETEPVARARATTMQSIASQAGLEITQCVALWPDENNHPTSAQIL